MKFLYFSIYMLIGMAALAQPCPIIPQPNSAKAITEEFTLTEGTVISYNGVEIQPLANFLQADLLKSVGQTAIIGKLRVSGGIHLELVKKLRAQTGEAYVLTVGRKGTTISATSSHGLFNGINSFLQLIRLGQKNAGKKTIRIAGWEINDEPRFEWRGILLDESRHFFGMSTVKELLDWMAFYKLNKFHWHLTDEPAWRIEIKSYPKLTQVGSTGSFDDPLAPANYYTQEQIKEIVAYAGARFIDVIPEIDMPGHAAAANRAYPAFSGGGSSKHPEFTFNPGLDTTYRYLSSILREADALFPSNMVHIGGDEVSFGNEKWNSILEVKKLMNSQRLRDLIAVEHYFSARMADTLYKLNNKVLLWDEAADTNLPRDKTQIFWWRHDHPEQLKKALDKGFATVLCPRLPFYFDFKQDSTQRYGRTWGKAFVSLDKLYGFNLNDLQLSEKQQSHILGVQAGIWTEFIPSKAKLQYMLFPRITALAETGWTQDARKDLQNFYNRVAMHSRLYREAGIYYYERQNPKLTPEPLTPEQITDPARAQQ
ncbi:beta-N-acetylhexosaminidase [Mucilaginibacter sp. PAMB04168]|uniref:beta-N-acetylhexosaminidase n=1 Tax=Mucilaginibacter sp. PAMB04168 TaxID=3138567 RepID=UPI0031F60A09